MLELSPEDVEEEVEAAGWNLNSLTELTFKLVAFIVVCLLGGNRLLLEAEDVVGVEGADEEWNLNCPMTLTLLLETADSSGELLASLSFSREDDLNGEVALTRGFVLLALTEADLVSFSGVLLTERFLSGTGSVAFLKSLKESFQLTESEDDD